MPLVSVGIPTYNRPDSLARSLKSLGRQTYKRLEVIVSDNCSPGIKTQQVVAEAKKHDRRLTCFRQDKNIGALNNFMFVLQQATGEYFMWLADDDRLDPGYIEQCVRYMLNHPDYTLTGGLAKYYSGSNFIENDIMANFSQDSAAKRVKEYYRSVIHNGIYYGVFRKDALSPMMKNCLANDWLYIAGIAFKGKVRTLPDVHIHRGRNINEKTVGDIVARMKYKGLPAKYPHLSISINVLKDILTSETYAVLGLPRRIHLAISCFFIIFNRYAVRHFYHFKIRRHAEIIIDRIPCARPFLKKAGGLIAGWRHKTIDKN
ncbi:MAG: glycosyltransferase family 2 protein [Spirochaetes bacterium]|nr:glycosyltransferase family 2 protein [Spirochaetota bacterium]